MVPADRGPGACRVRPGLACASLNCEHSSASTWDGGREMTPGGEVAMMTRRWFLGSSAAAMVWTAIGHGQSSRIGREHHMSSAQGSTSMIWLMTEVVLQHVTFPAGDTIYDMQGPTGLLHPLPPNGTAVANYKSQEQLATDISTAGTIWGG